MVNLTPAGILDSAGAQVILDAIRRRWPSLKHLSADSAYNTAKLTDEPALLDFIVEVVRRIDTNSGFKVLPRRWVSGADFRLDDPLAPSGPRL